MEDLDGRYLIHNRLGSGGMGTVYLASQVSLDRTVVIKVLASPLDDKAKARFDNEAKLLAGLTHPNIVTIHDFGQGLIHGVEQQYLVMELLEGHDLRVHLREQGALKPEEARYYMLQILDAMCAVHDSDIVHRDLKPSNIFLCRETGGRAAVKVIDFGISRALDELDLTTGNTCSATHTAPEFYDGAKGSPQSDVYALGLILFEMLTGRHVYSATNRMAWMKAHCSERVPSEVLAGVPVGELIAKAIAKAPEARFQNAGEMYQALLAHGPWRPLAVSAEDPTLGGMGEGESPPVELPTVPQTSADEPIGTTPGRVPWLVLAFLLGIAALVCAGTYLVLTAKQSEDRGATVADVGVEVGAVVKVDQTPDGALPDAATGHAMAVDIGADGPVEEAQGGRAASGRAGQRRSKKKKEGPDKASTRSAFGLEKKK